MSLPAGFHYNRSEALGVATGTSLGTTITASATIGTKGSWVSLGQTTFEWNSFVLTANNIAASDKTVDVGLSDDGTNWWVLVPGLRVAGRKYADYIKSFNLPMRVPTGKYIGVRCASSTASHTLEMSVVGSHANLMGMPGYSRAIALYTEATARGVAIDPGGTANTKSAWTQLIGSTGADVDSILVMMGQNTDVARTATARMLMDIGIGAGGAEFALVPNIQTYWTATGDGPMIDWGPIPASIPAGSRISCRAQCTDITAGDRTIDIGVIGFVV